MARATKLVKPKIPPTTRKKIVVVSPRKCQDLRHAQRVFIVEYLKDFDRLRAWKSAGYTSTGKPERDMALVNQMLRKPAVMQAINDAQIQTMHSTGINRDNTVMRMHLEYLDARNSGDHAIALKALVEIAKILGIYEAHNRQKVSYSMDDVERLKKELAEVGFNLDSLEPSKN